MMGRFVNRKERRKSFNFITLTDNFVARNFAWSNEYFLTKEAVHEAYFDRLLNRMKTIKQRQQQRTLPNYSCSSWF